MSKLLSKIIELSQELSQGAAGNKNEFQSYENPIVNKNGKQTLLLGNYKEKETDELVKQSLDLTKGGFVRNSAGTSELGVYESGLSLSSDVDLDIAAKMIVDKSTHISNWKSDVLVGNGNNLIKKKLSLKPNWDSLKQFMMLSRVIVWICPVSPDTSGYIKIGLKDQCSEDKEAFVAKGEGKINTPICFYFNLNWSYPKEKNTLEFCPIIIMESDQKYKKGAPLASVMYSWCKEFCSSPRYYEKSECYVIPISPAVRFQSAAMIEACKYMIPKGSSGKAIRKQIESLGKHLEQAAIDEENEEVSNETESSFPPLKLMT
ncbi:non-structural movement protein [Bean necrotic mosaic virus]|uniref:Non-structural movement protein n=1 Tax=Bean necrotic mosaic virus TaxID=1033976 RepID=I3PCT2_9VIRU|nr:non-structural movement protein [Bean necrotic mosaic virus]AER23989.1 non-structural movement protein [Bean necrotic mosaic virus]